MSSFRDAGGFIKPVLSIAVLVITAYSAFQFAMPYYRHAAFKSDVKEIARLAVDSSAEKIKTQIYESAREVKVPIKEDDIQVIKKEKTFQVKISWTEDVDIFGLYHKTLHFNLNIEE